MKMVAKNVTTAGTAVPISDTDLLVRSAVIQARKANTGDIYVGSSAVTNNGLSGTVLAARDPYTLAEDGSDDLYNLKDVYINADSSGDGVTVTYYTE
jgi:hypothetical protein